MAMGFQCPNRDRGLDQFTGPGQPRLTGKSSQFSQHFCNKVSRLLWRQLFAFTNRLQRHETPRFPFRKNLLRIIP